MFWRKIELERLFQHKWGEIPPNTLYREKLFSESKRPIEQVDKAALGLCLAKSEKLCIAYRAASFVVFSYKCIEENQVKALEESFFLMHDLESMVFKKIDFSKDFEGVRDDLRQIYLSLLTVRWHAEIFLGIDPLGTLEKVVEFSELVVSSRNFITLSQNVGRAALVYAYILFLQERFEKSKQVVDALWLFYCDSVKSLEGLKIPSSSHFGDLHRLGVIFQSAAAGYEWMREERKRENLWCEKKVMQLSSRVGLDPDGLFYSRFKSFFLNYGKVNYVS